MHSYAALIRGIGPGDPNKTNEKLRSVLESLGFSNVRSVISSGNIIFESSESSTSTLEAMIEAAWPVQLGFQATTIVRSQAELQQLLDMPFFAGMTHSQQSYLLISFLKRPAQPNFTPPYQPPGKPYVVLGATPDVLFTTTDNTVMKTTDLMTWLEKQFGKGITSRTPLTIARIVQRMSARA